MGRIIATIEHFRRQLEALGAKPYGIRVGMDEWAELAAELGKFDPSGEQPTYSEPAYFNGLAFRRVDRPTALVVHADNHASPARGVGYGAFDDLDVLDVS